MSIDKARLIARQEQDSLRLLNGLTKPPHREVNLTSVTLLLIITEPVLQERCVKRRRAKVVEPEALAGVHHGEFTGEREDSEECAIRELREETGYVGVATETSPMMFNDPGFCNTNLKMVHVSVDMDLPENKDLKPELEEGEFIEVFTVKLTDLWGMCETWEKEGCAVDARVGTLAEGILLAQRFKL
ncbi:Uncharacterized protein Y057_13151 [Fusarium fujikuroi]|nr:Uncharacterized protein Y057_13151 [Fusarium fujikuroi]